jgi:hypothetical protein
MPALTIAQSPPGATSGAAHASGQFTPGQYAVAVAIEALEHRGPAAPFLARNDAVAIEVHPAPPLTHDPRGALSYRRAPLPHLDRRALRL